jgi:hypothetical protein
MSVPNPSLTNTINHTGITIILELSLEFAPIITHVREVLKIEIVDDGNGL